MACIHKMLRARAGTEIFHLNMNDQGILVLPVRMFFEKLAVQMAPELFPQLPIWPGS